MTRPTPQRPPRRKGTRKVRARSAKRLTLYPGDIVANGRADHEYAVVLPGTGRFVLVTDDGDREFWLPREDLTLTARAPKTERKP